MTNEDYLIREILIKEEEKHQLIFMGAVRNLPEAIRQTLFLYKEKLFDKGALLDCFYQEVLRFSTFVHQQKASNRNLRNRIHRASDSYLKRKKANQKTVLDKELKSHLSIGWFYPAEVFDDFYQRFCSAECSFGKPVAVYNFFQEQVDALYPLDIHSYVRFLKADKPSFWEVTCQYIKDLIRIVSRHALFADQRAEQTELIQDEAWSDAYEILRSKLKEKKELVFQTGTDFRNYLISICHFRLQNRRKKYEMKEEPLDHLMDREMDIPDETSEELSANSLTDVDIENPYEVAYAIALILLDPAHPFYEPLTKGIEDKVDVLLRKVLQGQCYNTIVEEKWGLHPGSENFTRTVTKLRKEYERVRRTLQERFISLKKENVRCHISSFAEIIE